MTEEVFRSDITRYACSPMRQHGVDPINIEPRMRRQELECTHSEINQQKRPQSRTPFLQTQMGRCNDDHL